MLFRSKDDFVEFKNGAYAKSTTPTNLKVERVEELGYPFFVGTGGSPIDGDTTNKYGKGALDTRTTKYTIRVV